MVICRKVCQVIVHKNITLIKVTDHTTPPTFYQKYKVIIWMCLVLLQQSILLFTMNGTGDDGDSIAHFFHNRYAFKYPFMLIHSWAKPVFVLASCAFAQLGFIGIKLFNSLVAISAAFLSYKLAKKIDIPYAELAIPILMCMPEYLRLSFSGLTEPLFSLMAIGSLLLLANEKNMWAALLISFMPFSRPEGLYFIAIAGAYFILKKKLWKFIPLLLAGHLFYTLFGVVAFGETWLWIFTKNPNAMIDPAYNQTGRWLHYIRALRSILGLPSYVFFWVGCLAMSIPVVLHLRKFQEKLIPILILATTFSVIISHSIFWKFGLFKSFGLTRNLLTVAPMMAIITLAGMQGLWQLIRINAKNRFYANTAMMLLVIGFLYSGNKFTVKFPESFQLSALQLKSEEVADFIMKEYPRTHMTYHYYPHLSLAMNEDPFDWRHHKTLFKREVKDPLPENAIVVWDDWFAVMEGKVSLEMLHENEELEFVRSFKVNDESGKERTLAVFKTKKWL